MADIEVLLPKMGESVAEATITTWLKQEGDTIEAEESLVEIATDKVDSEVPAPEDGTITKILVAEGEVAKVGQPIAMISTNGSAAAEPVSIEVAPEPQEAPAPIVEQKAAPAATPAPAIAEVKFDSATRFYSPLVKSIAKEEGIALNELESVPGTGKDGRVTKKDILAYVSNRSGAPAATPATTPSPAATQAAPAPAQSALPNVGLPVSGGDEILEMDRMRKLIAEHMVMSKRTSPHVTSFVEADVTKIVNWRNKMKSEFFTKEGEKLTFTPLFIQAIVKAIRDFPMINVSLDGEKIIKKKQINIGMATALPSGNLIVPVIRNADTLNLVGLTRAVNDLANRARNNALKPDEIQGGTYTITNVGSFGNVMGTPIINQPQVAIMAVGTIQKKPSVIETSEGDFIGIRHKMFLSHSYDHRIVDGALGGMFVRKVADYLESFDDNQEL